ncbi:MAG TPA: FMN-dependent NADH-azoreductase [Woeseiaceae bacterium]|nr:FMN-dependent NADH-azoreductase [Woeseiaceae bacterium]
MQTLLNVRASLFGAESASSRLADRFVTGWLAAHPGGQVITRDLSPGRIPPLTAERFRAFGTPAAERTPLQAADVALSDKLIAELEAADVVVIAAPMYNFSVPATLRDYFDHVARAGSTFRYTAAGPEGLLKGKKTYVFITRGGRYSGAADTQRPYLEQFLGFLGLDDIEFVLAEGLAQGDDARQRSLATARASIDTLANIAA